MRILIDGMGGDNAPQAIVDGVLDAARRIPHTIGIVGREDEILQAFANSGKAPIPGKVEVIHASEVISNHDAPVRAVRTKKDSSIVKGLNMVKAGEADLFISAGNTGAIMAGGLFILGRIQGIDRPAITAIHPIMGGSPSFLVDAGANAECKPNNLLEFGIMGSIYMERVLGVENPRVGLVNNGTEETKGTSLTKVAYDLLSKSNLNFVGNVEARDLPAGICDVIVCDGFVGNVILKYMEGFAMSLFKLLKSKLTEGSRAKLGAALMKDKLMDLAQAMDYTEYGGAPILGVKGPVVKMHGSADAKAVRNTILKAIPFVENNVVETIQNSVLEIEEIVSSDD